MEQIYKISACGKPQPASCRPLRLAILTVCLLAVLSQVSARPSDVTKPEEVISSTSSSSSSPASTVLSHNLKRRSAEEDYDDEVDYERVKRCHEDEDVNELCQRCSKVTKSSIVFPMCCSNEDETMDWCKAYVYYGIQN
ncbi:hypothetical protein quinque_016133 [Culex quinquefasciatus]|uniref:uncharacterized protein LOC120420641 isoform X2 n=1 Tax=Culex pipiens pallens TaxID=42434 RepID=UPI001954E5E1|nr:uncharacterized protein LOC120420641 isoform X2 [Culex pipiens pallens]